MKYTYLTGPALAALMVTGCNEPEETVVAPVDEVAVVDPSDEAYPVGGAMNPQQQENYDAYDRDAAMEEYQTNREAMAEDTMAAGTVQAGGTDDAMAGQGDAASSGSMQGGMNGDAASVPALRPRGQMDFAYLDRNSDDQLSVGEYAIWAVRANPAQPKPDDQNRPFISTEQVNEAGQTFFYFDEDGNTYLSRQEFDTARASARTP